jgi:hypothetical protein
MSLFQMLSACNLLFCARITWLAKWDAFGVYTR